MPYALPDPTTPRVILPSPLSQADAPTTPEEAEFAALVEAPDVLDSLNAALDDLRPLVMQETLAANTRANIELRGQDAARILRGAGPALMQAWSVYDAARNAASKRADLSQQGKADATDRAREVRDATIARIASVVLSEQGDRLLALYPEPVLPSPSIEVATEAQLIFAAFDAKLPKTFAVEAIAALRQATTAPDALARLRANLLFQHAFVPLMRRRAEAPERHARPYADFSGMLAGVMQLHLDAVLGVATYRAAQSFVSDCRTSFSYLVTMAQQSGFDSGLAIVGAPVFAWDEAA